MSLQIFIPFYGPLEYLQDAVNSVLNQTDPDWQLTVVDDRFPSEAPARWLESLGDSRITYLRNEENLGVTGNFNRCIELSTADRVVLMGGDDKLLPNFVSDAKLLISEFPEAEIIQPGVEVINQFGVVCKPPPDRIKQILAPKASKPIELDSGAALASLMRGNWLYFPSLTWKREALIKYGFDSKYSIVQDLDLISKTLMDGGKLAVGQNKSFQYRRHSESLSSKGGGTGARYEEEASLFRELAPKLRTSGFRRAAKSAELHLTSRLAASVDLFMGLIKLTKKDKRVLLHHIFL